MSRPLSEPCSRRPARQLRDFRAAARAFAWLALLIAAQANSAALDCASPGPISLSVPAAPGVLEVELRPSGAAVLWIEEQGHDLRLQPAAPDALLLQVPPRFGLSLLPLDAPRRVGITRVLDNAANARVSLGLECAPLPVDLEAWLGRADAIARHFGGGLGSLRGVEPPFALAELIQTAPAPRWRAFALHLRAQWLLLSGLSAESAPAFVEAARAWDAVGAAPKAAAARVAAAENLRLAGDSAAVLSLSRSAPTAPEAGHYFGVRLEAARCGALFDRGELDPAAACHAWVLAAYKALDEPLEAANAAINGADLQRRLGRHVEARAVVLQALARLQGPQSDAVRGRAEHSLAETAAQLGDLPGVLKHLNAAQTAFDAAGEVRWQGHVLRRLAATLLELGNLADAQLALEASQALFDPVHAPLPYASGQLLQARLLRARGVPTESLPWLTASLATARSAAQRELQNLVLLELASTRLELADPGGARAALSELQDPSPRERARLELLRALAEKDAAQSAKLEGLLQRSPLASGAADGIDWTALSLSQRIDLQREQARALAASGRINEAQDGLLASARSLDAQRQRSGNALLAQALEGLVRRLRFTAFELLATAHPQGFEAGADADAERLLLQWLALGLPLAAADSGADWSALDAQIGRHLLGHAPAAQSRALLKALASDHEPAAPARAIDLRASLEAEAPLQLLLAGERHALLATWTRQGLRMHRPPDLQTLQPRLGQLSALASSQGSSLQQLHDVAAEVAGRLQPALSTLDPAEEGIGILADDLALGVEWALLPDHEGEPLGGSHRIRLRTLSHAGATQASAAALQLLQAAQWQSARGGAASEDATRLPALQAADAEAGLIRAALPGREVQVRALAQREMLLAALGQPGAWLHVSAHGDLQPGRVAGSGLWLDPAEGQAAPQFMSALDIRQHGAQAALVVLNACQLAAQQTPSSGPSGSQTSFAQSLVLAGVQHVVAARWPVSDTASHLWVPAYYRALQAQQDSGLGFDPAEALREARRALQRSRAFRHPFHWAAWVHLQQLPLLPRSTAHAPEAPSGERNAPP